jgi:hypothetical protein
VFTNGFDTVTNKQVGIKTGAICEIKTFEDFDLPKLVKLSAGRCDISSLEGIQNCPELQWIDLDYMRNLIDISDLTTKEIDSLINTANDILIKDKKTKLLTVVI